jgi:hypothetical protein
MLYSKVILFHNIILLSRPVDCCISFKTMNLEDVRQSTIISEACDGFEGEDDSRNSVMSCRHIAEMVHPFAKRIASPNRVVVTDLPFQSITHPM